MIPVYLEERPYTVELVRNNPDTLFVFGDNTLRLGKGGQAIIRDEPNTFGIATKHYPSSKESSFFSDDLRSYLNLTKDILDLTYGIHKFEALDLKYSSIALPYYGLGTGLAELPKRAPELYKVLVKLVYQDNGVSYKHLLEHL